MKWKWNWKPNEGVGGTEIKAWRTSQRLPKFYGPTDELNWTKIESQTDEFEELKLKRDGAVRANWN